MRKNDRKSNLKSKDDTKRMRKLQRKMAGVIQRLDHLENKVEKLEKK